ncbi:MAG: toll/interleukin-1 receptor domain-containing protein [Desulfobacteraceae bacterium]|nr:toll/interleukin-1 receptor domain-containing protein [Desulfobacteraceae bacterium]
MPAANKDEIKQFKNRCKKTIGLIDEAFKLITITKHGYDDDEIDDCPFRSQWYNLFSPIREIYFAEKGFVGDLLTCVGKHGCTKAKFAAFNNFIAKTDSAAKAAKDAFPVAYMQAMNLTRGRPELRELVRSHWAVYDEVEKNRNFPSGASNRFLKQLSRKDKPRGPLEKLEWIWGIVVSYSRKERDDLVRLLEIVEKELRKRHVHVWWDKEVDPACSWGEEIEEAFTGRDLAVTLISKTFFKSEFIKDKEVGVLTARRQRKDSGVVIFPIILELCNWKRYKWLKATQYLPANGKSIRQNFTDEESFNELAAEIARKIMGIMDSLSTRDGAERYMKSYERA